jgi:hypothetical protein
VHDPEALDAEADALLERVVAEFGSVPHAFGTKPSTLAALAGCGAVRASRPGGRQGGARDRREGP